MLTFEPFQLMAVPRVRVCEVLMYSTVHTHESGRTAGTGTLVQQSDSSEAGRCCRMVTISSMLLAPARARDCNDSAMTVTSEGHPGRSCVSVQHDLPLLRRLRLAFILVFLLPLGRLHLSKLQSTSPRAKSALYVHVPRAGVAVSEPPGCRRFITYKQRSTHFILASGPR